MFMTVAFLLSLASVICALRYAPARKQCQEKFLSLQSARRKAITTARKLWDEANDRQTAWRLTATLCLLGVVLCVFLPGVHSHWQYLPLAVSMAAFSFIMLVAVRCHISEQCRDDS